MLLCLRKVCQLDVCKEQTGHTHAQYIGWRYWCSPTTSEGLALFLSIACACMSVL